MKDAGERGVRFDEYAGMSLGRALLIALPVLALVVGSIWLAVQFLEPLPPRKIVLATGPEGSALHALGTRYAEILGPQGIAVEVRTTGGAGDNVDRLGERAQGIDAAFIVAGSATADEAAGLVNVSNLFHVALWCVSRDPAPEITLAGLKGRRIAIGAPGSGLHRSLSPLLQLNGITRDSSQLLALTPDESVRALAAGEADMIFLGEGAQGAHLAEALAVPGARLVSFPRAGAYARRFDHIAQLHLPAGTLDFARGVPDRDLSLIGTTLMIAARSDVHPTVVDLLVDAARQLHSSQGLFEKRGEFPNLHAVDDIPVSEQALLYAREGPSLLRRYLPLWAADALQRAIIIAVPLVAVIVPLVRYLPVLLEVFSRRQFYRWYAGLRRIERRLRARAPGEPVDDLLRELDRIEESIAGVNQSVIKAGELYTLRVHLRVVRESVLERVRAAQGRGVLPPPQHAEGSTGVSQ
ncbi:MAG: TAXI family TRAP transporter solute-binding subunit [Betaproteobacteria bacterium]